jgi:CheY-like chemotaxis protein
MTGGRRRILIIEDDPETAEQLVGSLAASGYQVDLTATGNDGGDNVDKIEKYRRLAGQCLHMAAGIADFQFKAIWIGMAGAWLKLADLAEKNSRAEGAHNLIPSACVRLAARPGSERRSGR